MTTDQAIDVGEILARLRAEVRAAQGLHDNNAVSGELLVVDLDELRDAIAEVEALRAVSAHWPLTWRTPRQRVEVFVQRLIRRALRWYIAPIVEQQNAYNNAVARALQLLLQSHELLAAEVNQLRQTHTKSTDEHHA